MVTSPSKQIFEMTDSTCSESPTKVSKLDKQWEERFEELQKFKKAHGSTSVPATFSRYASLAKWCEYQRARYNQGKLSEKRIDRLKKVGFVFEGNIPRSPENIFSAYNELWKKRIRDLKQFIATFGHANVPTKYADNPELGKWVSLITISGSSVLHAIDLSISSLNDTGRKSENGIPSW